MQAQQPLFTRSSVERIHAAAVNETPEQIVFYLFTLLQRRRADFDSVIILPRLISEFDTPPQWAAEPWRPLVRDQA